MPVGFASGTAADKKPNPIKRHQTPGAPLVGGPRAAAAAANAGKDPTKKIVILACPTCHHKFPHGGTQCPKCLKPSSSKTSLVDKKQQEQLVKWHELYDGTFKQYDKGGNGLRKADLASLIRQANDDFGFLSDSEFGPFVKQAFEDAGPSEENTLSFPAFARWYEGFEKMVDSVKRTAAAEEAATAAAKAAEKAARFGGSGRWECDLAQLNEALEAAWIGLKTPLIIDATARPGDDFTPLETFYSYSGNELLEMKKMVVEVNMKKEKSLDEAQAEAKEKLLRAMKRGLHFCVMLANSAPPMKSKFCSPTALPYTLLEDNQAVQSVRGSDADWHKVAWTKPLLTIHDMAVVSDKFNVLVVTKFSVDDYQEFLKAELPLDTMQHIVVTTKP